MPAVLGAEMLPPIIPHIYKRFSYLRTRLLLSKQSRLSLLQERLAETDLCEPKPLRLGSHVRDDNDKRKELIPQLSLGPSLRRLDRTSSSRFVRREIHTNSLTHTLHNLRCPPLIIPIHID
jgi:hypothetical protein